MQKENKKEEKEKAKGRIIFINSFKGGAGKTTLSLTHCISGLFHAADYQDSGFRDVIYMDLDILGTGTCYLFDEKLFTGKKNFEYTGEPVRVTLDCDGQTGILHAACLDPELKIQAALGDSQFVNHQAVDTEILKNRVLDFIRRQFQEIPETLLVVDCAPGFSELEQRILHACHKLAMERDILVEEEYVTTLDTAHIRKCTRSINDIDRSVGIRKQYRSVRIVVNDIQNHTKYKKEEEGPDADSWIERVAAGIRDQLTHPETELRFWRYSENVAVRSVFTMEQKVENHVPDYLFTGENYRKL